MWFQSKLFKFLLSLSAYLLFSFQWAYNYKIVWYANLPDETEYFFRSPNMSYYIMYAYLLITCFLLFLIFGLVYLLKSPAPKYVTYILIGVLVVSSYFVWGYSNTFKEIKSMSFIMYLNLVLFAFSIFKLSR